MSILTVTRFPSKNDFRAASFCAAAGVEAATHSAAAIAARRLETRIAVSMSSPVDRTICSSIGRSGRRLQAGEFLPCGYQHRGRGVGLLEPLEELFVGLPAVADLSELRERAAVLQRRERIER